MIRESICVITPFRLQCVLSVVEQPRPTERTCRILRSLRTVRTRKNHPWWPTRGSEECRYTQIQLTGLRLGCRYKGCDGNILFPRERCGENRVLRVYLSRSRTCSFFIAVLMGACTRLVRQHPSRSDHRCESEQTLSVQRYMRAGSIVNAIT